MSPEFLVTALIVVLAPGTGVIYTLAVALARGRLASVWAAFGCTVGIVPHMLAAILGVAAILHASALLFQTVKFAGVAYLLWLAWQTIRDRGALKVEAGEEAGSLPRIAVTGTLLNILNPKLYAAFATLFASFLPGGLERAAGMAVTGLTAFLIALVMNNFWILAGDGLAHLFSSPRQNRALRLILAGLMLLAVCLAVYKLVETGLPSGS